MIRASAIVVLAAVAAVRGQAYENCAVISAAKDLRIEWTIAGQHADIRFLGLSSGYVCLGLYSLAGREFNTRGHPDTRGEVDMWCANGSTLRDGYMEEEDVKSDKTDDLCNKQVESNGTHMIASFRRRLAGRSNREDYDRPILVDGSQQRIVWAIHPTRRDNGDSRHPRGPVRGSEANAGMKAIAFGKPSKCDVEQVVGAFVSGAGDFELQYGLVPGDASQMEFTMTAETSGWVSFGWADGTPAHIRSDMYLGRVSPCEVLDTWSTGKSRPPTDGSQDIVSGSVQCSTVAGKSVITFRRALNTGDSLTDLPIEDKAVLLQWAYATTTNFGSVHSQTGTGFVNFATAPGAAPVTPPPTPAPITSDRSFSAQTIVLVLLAFIVVAVGLAIASVWWRKQQRGAGHDEQVEESHERAYGMTTFANIDGQNRQDNGQYGKIRFETDSVATILYEEDGGRD